jgi:hypothetical protein
MQILPISQEAALICKLRELMGENAQIQQTDVRLEKKLTSTTVATKFYLNGEGATNRRPSEIFVGINDLVVLYKMKVAVQKVKNTTLAGNSGNSVDYTYPDKFIFNDPATATNVSEADALKALWNGTFSLKTNTIELQNIRYMSNFYIANQTQESATTQAQLNPSGFVDIAMPPIISGRDTTILEFNPAPGADLSLIGGAAGTENIFVIHFLAMVVRNGAQPSTWTEISNMLDRKTPGRLLV